MKKFGLGVIGAGNMAYAIISGALTGGVISADELAVSDVSDTALARFKELDARIYTTYDNAEIFTGAERVLFAVKPQTFRVMPAPLDICADLVISIMAGVKTSSLKAAAPNSSVIRVMPNTPAQIGMGMAALTEADNPAHTDFVRKLFGAVGETVILPESAFDAVTAVSGSGPAYVYYFMRAVRDAALKLGLDGEDADKFVLSTFKGAAELYAQSKESLDGLIAAVTSKGGTTEAALKYFDGQNVGNAIVGGVEAAAKRSREL